MGNHRVANVVTRGGGPHGNAPQHSGGPSSNAPQHSGGPSSSAPQHSGGPHGSTPQYAGGATTSPHFTSPSALALRNWPVSTRLIAVIVVALLMGLVFGGLRVSSAADSADEFGRVSQLAELGQQVTGLVQALENERDQTTAVLPVTDTKPLTSYYSATDAVAAKVQSLASGVGGGFPANIQSRAATVINEITHL